MGRDPVGHAGTGEWLDQLRGEHAEQQSHRHDAAGDVGNDDCRIHDSADGDHGAAHHPHNRADDDRDDSHHDADDRSDDDQHAHHDARNDNRYRDAVSAYRPVQGANRAGDRGAAKAAFSEPASARSM